MNPNSSTVHDQLLNVGSNHTLLKSQIATAWVSSPLTRGTPDILWSCIVTLSACVYTAIHLNIPALPTSRFRELWRKLKWVGIALFAPEVVLYTAIQQFYEAWQLAAKMNQLCRGEAEEEVGLLRSTVTMLKQLVFTSKDLDLEEAEVRNSVSPCLALCCQLTSFVDILVASISLVHRGRLFFPDLLRLHMNRDHVRIKLNEISALSWALSLKTSTNWQFRITDLVARTQSRLI